MGHTLSVAILSHYIFLSTTLHDIHGILKYWLSLRISLYDSLSILDAVHAVPVANTI